jgi:hypothetical protein
MTQYNRNTCPVTKPPEEVKKEEDTEKTIQKEVDQKKIIKGVTPEVKKDNK